MQCMIANDISSMHYCKFYRMYCNSLLFNSLLLLTCSIAVDNFCRQLKSFTCTVTVADFSIFFVHDLVIYKCVNALSQLTTFVCPIAIDYKLHAKVPFATFSRAMTIANLHWHYHNELLSYSPLLLTTFIYTIFI